MKIVVCLKQVPDTKTIRIDQKTKNIIRDGVPSILNPYDENALEEALRIRDQQGGVVIALSMGPLQAKEVLQKALNMGADQAILLADRAFAGADTLATGYTLATVIKQLNADLILCGSEAIDGCTGQVGPIIAEMLEWPQFTYVDQIKVSMDDVQIRRELNDRYEIYRCRLPLVACIKKGINIPRAEKNVSIEPEIHTAENYDFIQNKIGMSGSATKVIHISTSDQNVSSFFDVDRTLSVRERIRIIVNGGMLPKDVKLERGNVNKLSEKILDEPLIRKCLSL